MNAEMLSNEVDVDLITEGIKYSLKVPTSYIIQYISANDDDVLVVSLG